MANPRNTGMMGNVGNRITRRQFILKTGIAGGAVAAAGLGLSGVAHAAQTAYQDNPDPAHIVKKGQPMGGIPATNADSEIWVYPVGTSNRQTLLQARRKEDPRISKMAMGSLEFDPTTGFFLSAKPLSETYELYPDEYLDGWDPSRRTIDCMNIMWAANTVAKKTDGSPGEVVLKSVATPFEFGVVDARDLPPGPGAMICNDCIIRGEIGDDGNLTAINGDCVFIANWWLSWYFTLTTRMPPGAQIWHDSAASFTLKDLIIQNGVYPRVLAYTGFDLSVYIPEYGWWFMPAPAQIEMTNVRIINAAANMTGGGPLVHAFAFENLFGSAKISNCYVQITGYAEDAKGILADGPDYVEIRGNDIDTSQVVSSNYGTASGLGIEGILLVNYSSAWVEDNHILSNPYGIGIFAGGSNGRFQNNDFRESNLMGWSVDSSNKLIQTGCLLLDQNSSNNYVNESLFPAGGNLCTQIADLTVYNANPNIVPKNTLEGIGQCNIQSYFQLMQKIKQAQEFQELKAKLMTMHIYQKFLLPPYGKYEGWPKNL